MEWWLDNKHVGTPARLRIGVDNTVVIGAWRRLFSLKLSLLDLLIGLQRRVEEARLVVELYFVYTKENRADQYTRIKAPHPYYTK